jgi:hypothetical protein
MGRHVCGPLNTHKSGGVQGPCRWTERGYKTGGDICVKEERKIGEGINRICVTMMGNNGKEKGREFN